MARFVADGFAVQAENRESLAGGCPRVVLFHLQDYAVLGLLEHDPFVWPESATEGCVTIYEPLRNICFLAASCPSFDPLGIKRLGLCR